MALEQFMNPSKEIIRYIDNLELLYQLIHQENIKVFIEKGGKSSYSGTLQEYAGMKEAEDVLMMMETPWDALVKAIKLLKTYDKELDITKMKDMNDEQIAFVVKTIKEGLTAKEEIEKWIEPLEKTRPIVDATKVGLDGQFEVLKIHDFKKKTEDNSIHVVNEIYEITSPEELIEYIKIANIQNSLILTIQRNKKFDFRGVFHIFFIYHGVLYNINNQDRRLNVDNTAGMRNPGRHIERTYEKVWLPVYLLEESGKEETLPVIYEGVRKISTVEEVAKVDIGYSYWLEIFMYRIMHKVITDKIMKGYTPNMSIKLLESGEKKPVQYGQVNTRHGSHGYLYEAYGTTTTALALTTESLPAVIGTKQFITEMIEFRKQKNLADAIQDRVIDDYIENKDKVKEWIMKFISKFGLDKTLEIAFKDEKYSFMKYPRFTEARKIFIEKKAVLDITTSGLFNGDHENVIAFGNWHNRTCSYCNQRYYLLIKLTFYDYRQFSEFFNINPDKLPTQMVNHLHQQSQMYIGNEILDDVDPIDMISDPWFQHHYSHRNQIKRDRGEWLKSARIREPVLEVFIPVCRFHYKDKGGHLTMHHVKISTSRGKHKCDRCLKDIHYGNDYHPLPKSKKYRKQGGDGICMECVDPELDGVW